jgi:hypothetical protein
MRLLGGRSQTATTALPALPAGPLYIAVPRGDSPPPTPMTDGNFDEIEGASAARPPATDSLLPPGASTGPQQYLRTRPEDVGAAWPCRVYELGDVVNLRWSATVPGSYGLTGEALRKATEKFERSGGLNKPSVFRWLSADDATIAGELPGWRYFGPHGERVPDILEEIWTLDPARVAALPEPPARGASDALEKITTPVLPAPAGELERAASNASSAVIGFFESRSWATGAGGGFYYRGCYFTWVVSDPRWLAAMGLALNAVRAAVTGPAMDPAVRRRAFEEWHALAGR